MKKILLLMAVALAFASCGDKQPKMTAEELIVERIDKMKEISTKGIENYIKKHISSDPDYGKIIETSGVTLNDTVYSGTMRIAFKNVLGGTQQKGDCVFYVCREKDMYYVKVWETQVDFYLQLDSDKLKYIGGETKINQLKTYKYVINNGEQIKKDNLQR